MTAMTKLEVGLNKKITYMMMIYLTQKLKRLHKTLQTMSQERKMAIGFMLAFSENRDKILDSICSPADVDHLIVERNECGKSQKAENLTKEPHDINNTSSQNYVNPVNYAPINVDTGLTQDSVDTVFVEGKIDNYYTETTITCDSEEGVQIQNIEEGNITVDSHDELDLWEPEQIPHALIRLAKGQIPKEFMLEEEIEFQGIDKCKIVQLPDKQEIEWCIDREMVGLPEMPVRIAYEQEECIEEICDRSLPKMYRVEESVHKDEIWLERPKINTVEISELPREVK